jgi:hypothetical protein
MARVANPKTLTRLLCLTSKLGKKSGTDFFYTETRPPPCHWSIISDFCRFMRIWERRISYADIMKRMIALLALIGAPVTAHQSKPDVVVEAPANLSAANARQYVTQITDTSQGQVARFQSPVCPLVAGLPDETNRKISARIRNTARSLGAELAPEQCDANLVVLVTDDISNSLAELRRTGNSAFSGLSPSEIDALAADTGPVRSWTVVSLRNEDGDPVHVEDDRNAPRTMRVKSASIFRETTRVDIEGSFILIERSAANGKTIAQIADYAAMRGLARIRLPKTSSPASILTLFDGAGASPAPGLTWSDRAYLQALYRFSGRESVSEARSRLSRGLTLDR